MVRAERARRNLISFVLHTFPGYQAGWFHRDVCARLEAFFAAVERRESPRLMIFAPPRSGKCLPRGAMVSMADGSRKEIEKVNISDIVVSLNSEYDITSQVVIETQENGVKPVLRFTLYSGRQVTCTDNHPLLTVTGWREAGQLTVDDSIATTRYSPMPDAESLPFGFAALMGYLVGDGSFGKGNPIVTSTEPEVVEHLREIAAAHNHKLSYHGKFAYHLRRINRSSTVRDSLQVRLREYMPPAKSADKRVPPCIWAANEADLRDFIAAYFNCDGSVGVGRPSAPVAEFYSISEGLLRDVQQLLSRFGIVSILRNKVGRYKGQPHHSWRLVIGSRDLRCFAERIPVRGERGEKLRDAVRMIGVPGKRHFPQYESIPYGWKLLTKRSADWHRKNTGIRFDKNYKCGIARQIVLRLADAEDNDDLRRICNPSLVWDRIRSIERIGDHPTYDIQVDGEHNFVTDGVVVHNSEIFSRRAPAYFFGKSPDLSIIATSYSFDLAGRMNRDVQRIIDGDAYRDVFPGVGLAGKSRPTGTDRSYVRNTDLFEIVGGDGSYRSAGVGGGITGAGANILILDDPIKDAEQAYSQTYRDKLWEWYTTTAYTRLMPGGGVLLGVTRWHEDDLAGRLLAAAEAGGDKWEVALYPAIAEADETHRKAGEALHPERYPLSRLEAIRGVVGSTTWAALYQQRPAPAEGGLFKRQWFPIVEAVPAEVERLRWWDLAATADGDWTVGTKLARTKEGVYYVEDVVRGRWTPHERDAVILQTAKLDGPSCPVWFEREPGSAGVSVVASLVRLLDGFTARGEPSSGDKVTRAGPFAAQCEAGNVKLLNGKFLHDWIEEFTVFPNGKHDDQVDSATLAYNKLASARKVLHITAY